MTSGPAVSTRLTRVATRPKPTEAQASTACSGDLTIATIVAPRTEEVAAPTAEAAAEVAEPELIRKPREEEEGEEGEAEAPPKG